MTPSAFFLLRVTYELGLNKLAYNYTKWTIHFDALLFTVFLFHTHLFESIVIAVSSTLIANNVSKYTFSSL